MPLKEPSQSVSEAKDSEGERAIERRSACRTCRRVTVRMEETPEAKTVEVKGAGEEEEEAMEEVPWQEAVPVAEAGDSRTSEEVRSRCSRDENVQSSFEEVFFKSLYSFEDVIRKRVSLPLQI